MEYKEPYNFRNMTDDEIAEAVLYAVADIKDSYYKYGEIVITISGGTVKHIDVRKPLEKK